jgi:hypothetical protein
VSKAIQVSLLGKPGCHLCDDARAVVAQVVAEFDQAHAGEPDAPKVELTETNILEDDSLAERYREEIPVLLIDGKVHNYWRIDPIRFRNALDAFAAE